MHLTAQDDRALTAKAVAHLCGLLSRDAWHSEHVSHSDLASIVKSFGAFIFIYASDTDFNQIMGIERIVYLSEDCIRKAVLPNHHGWF